LGNDHVLARISSNAIVEPPPHGEPVRRKPLLDYWNSLCRVFDLDVDLVLPGHGPAVTDHRQVISERFRFYEQRLDRIREALREGSSTVWQLAGALFRQLDAVDTFLACSEVIGHLDVLAERGEVVQLVGRQGEWEYSRQQGAL
jgi:glyoxylase-like metal-dependent hydrolase (beta-lactamase superfamily II)